MYILTQSRWKISVNNWTQDFIYLCILKAAEVEQKMLKDPAVTLFLSQSATRNYDQALGNEMVWTKGVKVKII